MRGMPYEVRVPNRIDFKIPIKSCAVSVKLTPGQDDDLIEYMLSIQYGFRSSVMKQILRSYCDHLYILPYAEGSGCVIETKLHSNNKRSNSHVGSALMIESNPQIRMTQMPVQMVSIPTMMQGVPQMPQTVPNVPESVGEEEPKPKPKKKPKPKPEPPKEEPPIEESPKEEPPQEEEEFNLFDMIGSLID